MRGKGGIFPAEVNSMKNAVHYFHLRQTDLTYKYTKETFNWNRLLNRMLFGMSVSKCTLNNNSFLKIERISFKYLLLASFAFIDLPGI